MYLVYQYKESIFIECLPQENGGGKTSDVEDNIPTHHLSTFNLHIPDQVTLWKVAQRPETSEQVKQSVYILSRLLLTQNLKLRN